MPASALEPFTPTGIHFARKRYTAGHHPKDAAHGFVACHYITTVTKPAISKYLERVCCESGAVAAYLSTVPRTHA